MNIHRMPERVRVWEETTTIPTYPIPAPDRNPMFLEKRIYQGSSGRVYPNAFTDNLNDEKIGKSYQAVFLENEYIQLMILPEIGGRIHAALDKTNQYNFIYRQNVIKPALVGLLGPWISGGIEFNWPQHHRPSTFMPVEHMIEHNEDGSCTVWLSEHEPMNRMKGMVGICLHPGRSLVEAKVRLYNRTPFPQTFLWWANVGIQVHDQYQAFFPPDVHYVADHAKRAVSWYPVAKNFYYGVDYTAGVDISWYKNIPVPTSYMVLNSEYDFFGGYDHASRAGIVHVANHHIAPGKKMWTWGNAEFGYAWDRELTDADGPYIELMAGVYTDNQPDFSWLQPYETRSFSQYWYPIQEIGRAKNANQRVAVNLEKTGSEWKVGVCSTEALSFARAVVVEGDRTILDTRASIVPGRPFVALLQNAQVREPTALLLRLMDNDGREVIRYRPQKPRELKLPSPATEIPAPEDISSQEELYLSGLHLEQYRHATRLPERYWREALRRDPDDARCNNAVGLLLLRRGLFAEAETHFRAAIATLTRRNPNPYDGEPFYNLGLTLQYLDRSDDAYTSFHKSVWNYAWQAPGFYALACIDCQRSDFESALEHIDLSLRVNSWHLKARNLKTAILRKLGRKEEALELACANVAHDGLDFRAQNEVELLAAVESASESRMYALMRNEPRNVLDLAFEYAEAAFWGEAMQLIERFVQTSPRKEEVYPMLLYALGSFQERSGTIKAAQRSYMQAAKASPDYCFPITLDEMQVLERALRANPEDARAQYYLGTLLYAKDRCEEAICHWESACRYDPEYSVAWRNLGIAYYNTRHDAAAALRCYEKAFAVNPSDARLLYELDQLRKRIGSPPEERLAVLEQNRKLTDQRDDLTIEVATLFNETGQSEKALNILLSRRFHPWEGGEGLVSGQYVNAHLFLGRRMLEEGDAAGALAHFEAAQHYPINLGEGKHLLTSECHLHYFAGEVLKLLGRSEEASRAWEQAVRGAGADPVMKYYKALSLRRLGSLAEADEVLRELLILAEGQLNAEVKIDYFATSLPNMLLFQDDLRKRNRVDWLYIQALARLGLGQTTEAIAGFRQTLELDLDHVQAREELSRAERLLVPTQHHG